MNEPNPNNRTLEHANPVPTRLRFMRFTMRALLGWIAVAAILIVGSQFAWPRRTIRTSVISPTFDIRMLEPHLDDIAEQSQTIKKVRCDPATNSIMIHAQARHIEAARKEIESTIADPATFLASASLGITRQEARELDQQ